MSLVYQKPKKARVFVAMSGGVDSSVAALLLKRQGYDVTGVFMKCWSGDAPLDKLGMNCAWERDSEDARRVAGKLKIPFYVWDFEREYKKRVVEYMVQGYRRGITPNPDVMCNREIKFGLFLERARASGADYFATGHFVRLRRTATSGRRQVKGDAQSLSHVAYRISLFTACDKDKDQSYFLWTLTQKQLAHCLFPIGDYLKSEVRAIARRAGLSTATKKDSQGICFLGKFSLKDFLKKRIRSKRGGVITTSGAYMGEHDGAAFYTIGQRHGLAIGDKRHAKPFYVAEKDVNTNTLVVAEGEDNPALYRREIILTEVNFLSPFNLQPKTFNLPVMARVRYRQTLVKARLSRYGSSVMSNKLLFEKPQKAVAPGQSAVFYSRRGEMLGGGVIVKAD
jgi:tRNA-specific 2-thiouridylase